eukprot:gene3045-3509_t
MLSNTSNHLERTVDASRSKILTSATVEQIDQISPTVKKLLLRVASEKFSFKAGQWVDFVIPDVDTVGGFSMCSSPGVLEKSHTFELAVKESSHPPAKWIHQQCKVGDQVFVKSGGDCFWDSDNESRKLKSTLLVAGGIGINPILSILEQIEELRAEKDGNHNLGKAMILYSASSKDELIFKDKLDMLTKNEDISCKYFITKEISNSNKNTATDHVNERRINEFDISKAVQLLANEKGIDCYMCGPPPMISCLQGYLKKNGLQESDIHFEQWW